VTKLPRTKEAEALLEKFPNEAVLKDELQANETNPDNYFQNMEIELIRKKYIQFTVYLEALYEVLELSRLSTVDQFAHRIRDIVIASKKD